MKKSRAHLIFILVAVLFAAAVSSASAGDWEYIVGPYFLGTGLDGTIVVRDKEANVDMSFSEIFENLEFGMGAHFESDNGTWVILSDFAYVGFGASTQAADVDAHLWLSEAGLGRRLHPNVEVLLGGRLIRFEGEIRITGPIGILAKDDQSWFDPYVGARIRAPLSDRFTILVRGDIGGFGVGSDFAWYFNPALAIDISESVSLFVLYRIMDMEFENEEFKFDAAISGPGAGVAFRF